MTHKRYSQNLVWLYQHVTDHFPKKRWNIPTRGRNKKTFVIQRKKMLGKITDLRFHHIHPLRCISQLIMFGIKQERKKKDWQIEGSVSVEYTDKTIAICLLVVDIYIKSYWVLIVSYFKSCKKWTNCIAGK